MKTKILIFSHYWNLLYIILFLIPVFTLPILGHFKSYIILINTSPLLYIRFILVIPIIYLWIIYIKIWAKYDRVTYRLLMLIFLNSLYFPFYYYRIRKNNWFLDSKKESVNLH